ncbi:hypothetical protein N5C96_29195 [Delftia tsuruhatensis]|uniref:hypothetical protein n=1 Tax=Delftia tsuruhatensis TaxID=180282 RepID=UPI002444DAFE|nr:hypothetical protein [Delftia tsuruhatensis]MDH0777495.1 hypothetical protein [Delftia tsuruhatensis]MDH1461828.1 hypothetical protein [Delftia tsuruhatensis]WGG09993.1 hypothetical protein N5O86_25615 [Delftia tsuruhatensis]
MSEASKPTPGPWTVSGLGGPWEQSLKIRAPSWGMVAHVGVNPSIPHWDLPQRANAALIAEAGTVHHETGLTPRQLVEQRDALAAALAGLDEAYCRAGTPLSRDERTEDRKRLIAAREALALVKGAKP